MCPVTAEVAAARLSAFLERREAERIELDAQRAAEREAARHGATLAKHRRYRRSHRHPRRQVSRAVIERRREAITRTKARRQRAAGPNTARMARLDASLTQREAAERAGLSVRTVQRIENGSPVSPTRLTLRRLAKVYGASVEALRPDP